MKRNFAIALSIVLSALTAHAQRSNASATAFEAMTVSTSAGGFAPATLGAVTIATSSVASASVITTSAPHGIAPGQTVTIAGHSGSTPTINGSRVATVITSTTFSIPVTVTVAGTGGTVLGPPDGSTQIRPSKCEGVVETAAIRYRADGTNPTSSVGIPKAADSLVTLSGYRVLLGFRAIRSGGSDATIYWQCYRE